MNHIAYDSGNLVRCQGCRRNTTWRVRAGTSVYIVCLNCMSLSERACANNTNHDKCTED